MDYWNHPMVSQDMLTIVDPQRSGFFKVLNQSAINYEIVTNNYQTVVENERATLLSSRANSPRAFDYEKSYHTYQEIIDEIKAVAAASKLAFVDVMFELIYYFFKIPTRLSTSKSALPFKVARSLASRLAKLEK